MEDGTLLSPERPALALDSSLLYRALRGTALATEAEAAVEPEPAAKDPAAPPPPPAPPRKLARSAPNGEVWSTYSTVGALTYRHVLVPLLREPYALTLEELAQNDGQGDHKTGTVVVENAEDAKPTSGTVLKGPLALPTCDRTDFKLFHTVPLLPNGWALIGETAKWIPISTARIRSVSYTIASDSEDSAAAPVTVQLSGVVNETIAFGCDRHAATCPLLAADDHAAVHRFVKPTAGAATAPIQYVSCTFGATGTLTMTPAGCVDRPW